jgi:endogenous inhibitor of DNA gyrase (YacG/DUF329 family)
MVRLYDNPMVWVVCEECGNDVPRHPHRMRASAKRGSTHVWCSQKCQSYWLNRDSSGRYTKDSASLPPASD